ncbi:hypothetical protein CYFUS_001216 [Cystobacter fuscus]|uniref:Uncharacterized protein n=1 Tax=Cystobacter fuscus TaxID=43 RepID=A0A250IX44_9BACT|nr:hypothetical protein [Cystobacter fuscus]ATB35802.1 hypothetical protein CYFUS_001216 [Cystobacter fuscus]
MGLNFLVTGGYFDGSGEGAVWHVDLTSARADVFLRWVPPAHLRVPRKGFAGGCLASEDSLYVAAHAAVVRVGLSSARVTGVLHQPSFNDLHHVAVSDGRLYIVNTGLGTIDIHELGGRFVGSHALLPSWANHWRMSGQDPSDWSHVLDGGWDGGPPAPWLEPRELDAYHDLGHDRHRLPFARLKVPDYLHPNHIRPTSQQTLVTCLYDGSVRDLRTFETVLSLPESHPHDGVLTGEAFWTTSIDGRVYAAPLRAGRVSGEAVTRLQVFATGHAGWCRGLWTDGRLLVVGLTEVRRGKLPRHRWADREPEGTETSLLLMDLSDGRLLARVDLTDCERHSKIYSILPWGESS